MKDEKDVIAKLEERLANATATFKEMRSQLDAATAENMNLKNKVAELEDELTLNGGAKEEVEGLKTRLEKAKEIFATQKSNITELTKINLEATENIKELEKKNDKLEAEITTLIGKVSNLEGTNEYLRNIVEQIKEIINLYNGK